MILTSKVNGIPNGKHKQFIAPKDDKAILKTGSYELIKGLKYEVNFPDGYEAPDWFEKTNNKHKVSGVKE